MLHFVHWSKVKILSFLLLFMELHVSTSHVTQFENSKTLNAWLITLLDNKHAQTNKMKTIESRSILPIGQRPLKSRRPHNFGAIVQYHIVIGT